MAARSYTSSRRRRGAPTIDRVLDAAQRLIVEGEFHSATMDELATAAGVSRATVFNRFGTKLGVLEAVADRSVMGPEVRAVQKALEIEDPVESLESLIEAVCALWDAHGSILEQLKAIVVLEPGAAALIDQQREEQRADLRALTRRLARAGRLRSGLGEAKAAATLHMLTSLESFLLLRRQYGLSLKQTCETIRKLALTLLRG